jgi:hypothetical protein
LIPRDAGAIDPDGGSGADPLAIVAGLGAFAALSFTAAFRRLRDVPESA